MPVHNEHPLVEPNTVGGSRPSLLAHFRIARLDHWFKNVFVVPGVIVALSVDHSLMSTRLLLRLFLGFLCVGLVASSNYVINELLDAAFDRNHPSKCKRPVPSGQINIPLAYLQWVALMIAGVWLGLKLSIWFAITMLAFWVMGCIYNIPPIRSKDLPYVDVLSEGLNNPIRMLAGWYLTGIKLVPPASLLISYWMVGCYFMSIKRFAECRWINDSAQRAAYRKSFRFYTQERLLVSIVFYGSNAMLFLGAFIVRYRLELILSFPLVALVMAIYLSLAFREDSPTQRPESLYREPVLMVAVVSCALLMSLLLFINIPLLHQVLMPSIPPGDPQIR